MAIDFIESRYTHAPTELLRGFYHPDREISPNTGMGSTSCSDEIACGLGIDSCNRNVEAVQQVDDHNPRIHIPVRFLADGSLQYFYGGAVPEVAPGTTGDMIVPEASLRDPADIRRVKGGNAVQMLPAGTVVRFLVDGDDAPAELATHLEDARQLPSADKPHAVEVKMRDPAVLRLRAGRPATIDDARCWIPSLGVEAHSLSHAYRLVSERFEPSRLSNTGNIFQLGYGRLDKMWRRLDDLRREHEAPFDMRGSQIGSNVLGALPSRVGAVLQTTWVGPLQSPKDLSDALHQYRQKLRRLHEASDLADVETAFRLIDDCESLLDSISTGAVQDHHRLVQAAVMYLIREDDEESDTQSLVGFDDDALVVRTVAGAIGSG